MVVGTEIDGIEGRPGRDGRPGRLTVGIGSETSNAGTEMATLTAIVGIDGNPGSAGRPGSESDGNPQLIP